MPESFSNRITRALMASLGGIFALLACVSFVSSCHLDASDPLHYLYEYTRYRWDPVWLSALICAALTSVLYAVNPRLKRAARIPLLIALLALYAALGAAWSCSVRALPAFDSLSMFDAAARFARGDYAPLLEADAYFRAYPFQLGYTALIELCVRLFGDGALACMQLLNVLSLCAAYAAIYRLAGRLFEEPVQILLILLLFCLAQPALLCTFVYGILPGLALSLWGIERLTCYLQKGRPGALCAAALFIALAVLMKYNCLIAAVAMTVTLALHALRQRRPRVLCAAAAMLLLPLLAQGGVKTMYEARARTALGPGMPQTAWLAMGLSQGEGRSAGWHTASWLDAFYASGCDARATGALARDGIKNSLWRFSEDPGSALRFFGDKLLSQWTEPTFESVWVSEVREHDGARSAWVRAVFDGAPGEALAAFMNAFQSIVYCFAAAGFWAIRKRGGLAHLPLALTVLGGGLYHMLFEAKSMYILPYYVMLFPYAAYGAYTLLSALSRRMRAA